MPLKTANVFVFFKHKGNKTLTVRRKKSLTSVFGPRCVNVAHRQGRTGCVGRRAEVNGVKEPECQSFLWPSPQSDVSTALCAVQLDNCWA